MPPGHPRSGPPPLRIRMRIPAMTHLSSQVRRRQPGSGGFLGLAVPCAEALIALFPDEIPEIANSFKTYSYAF